MDLNHSIGNMCAAINGVASTISGTHNAHNGRFRRP
jgi:hypothetical protein